METYVVLVNYTQQQLADIKNTPARIVAAREALERAGGKWLSWHLTLGRYDAVAIMQAPDSKTIATVLLATGMLGYVSTETLRGFTEDEFEEILTGLP